MIVFRFSTETEAYIESAVSGRVTEIGFDKGNVRFCSAVGSANLHMFRVVLTFEHRILIECLRCQRGLIATASKSSRSLEKSGQLSLSNGHVSIYEYLV